MEDQSFVPIRDESMQIIGYREKGPGGRVSLRNKKRELVGWTQFGQTRKKDGTLASFQENEGLLYKDLD